MTVSCSIKVLRHYTGFRKSERCQSTQSKYECIKDWPGQLPLSLIFSDWIFFDKYKRPLVLKKDTDIDIIYFLEI